MLVQTGDASAAAAVVSVAQQKLSRTWAKGEVTVQRYPKSPGHFEIVFVATPTHPVGEADFQTLMHSLGRGWESRAASEGTMSAIWNPSPDGKFFDPAVIWANLEVV